MTAEGVRAALIKVDIPDDTATGVEEIFVVVETGAGEVFVVVGAKD